jgi:hypothetical protein
VEILSQPSWHPSKLTDTVAIKNNGQTPAYHINDWMDDCATPLKALIDQDCAGERGDTKGGTNTIGKIVFEATVKKGDTW